LASRKTEDMRTLNDLKVGESAPIIRIGGQGALKHRIMEMGLTRGTTVQMRKIAPLGDPIEISVRGYELSIRRIDAAEVQIGGVTC